MKLCTNLLGEPAKHVRPLSGARPFLETTPAQPARCYACSLPRTLPTHLFDQLDQLDATPSLPLSRQTALELVHVSPAPRTHIWQDLHARAPWPVANARPFSRPPVHIPSTSRPSPWPIKRIHSASMTPSTDSASVPFLHAPPPRHTCALRLRLNASRRSEEQLLAGRYIPSALVLSALATTPTLLLPPPNPFDTTPTLPVRPS
ncbi:hypothetical protein HETIRDRAFT_454418 [Heterobasidion irregulare TC 32-1]|nr:uncharacterized protein HETIRDRAFT_454418 [Heterobasidion irregulare TC 32-1]ETW76984.1 hypothetical protein HETIRDRAFT_454418 [Heterobasidion irregulare TC 32-1]